MSRSQKPPAAKTAGVDKAPAETLSLDDDLSVLAVRAANKLTAHSSNVLRSRYGIGAIEWRMLVMLTLESGISAARVSEVVGIDKSAVSRALAGMLKSGLVAGLESRRDPRRKTWKLTARGRKLHDRIYVWARERDDKMLESSTKSDQEAAKAVLRQIIAYFEYNPDRE